MSAYSNTVTNYLEKYLENAAYNLFEFEDISIPQMDTYGNRYTTQISPLFLPQVVNVPQNQELLNIIMEEVPFYYIEPDYSSGSDLKNLTPTRDIGQIDVPSALQSEFWEVWFRNSFGDMHNNLLLNIFNKLRYPFVNENQYLSAMLFSELADKAYYSSSNTTVGNKLSFQDKNSENIQYLNDIMDTKLASIYSMLDYAPNQSELISYWTESLYESGQMSAEDISKESEVFKLQDLKHELYRRKFAGSVTLYNLALKSVNLQGTISGTLQVSAFGILQKAFNDTRLIRLLSAYELISGTPMTLEFSPIKEFYNKELGTNNSAIPLGVLEPLYYTSAPAKINGYQQEYSAQKFYFEPVNTDGVFEGVVPTRDEYQKTLLRNQNTVINWITPERVLSNIDQKFYLTLDDRMEDDSSEIRLKLDKGVQLTDQYLDLVTLDVAAKPIPLTAYTNTAIDISVNKFYYYRNVLQEKQAEAYPFLTSRIAKGNSVFLIDSKWMNYIQTITEAKSKVGDVPTYGAQVSKFYPYTDTIFKERPFFYLSSYTEKASPEGEEIQYADLFYIMVRTNQNEKESGTYGLVELLSRSHIARILLPREVKDGEYFDPTYPTERDISYTYARGILPFTYTANDLIDPGKTVYNSISYSEQGSLEFHDNITDRGYTPVIYVFSNHTLGPSATEVEVPSSEPEIAYTALQSILEDMGYTLSPKEDTVFVQYLVKFGNTFRLSEPIYILNGMVGGNYTSIRPKLTELLDTGKIVWTKLQENYRSEHTALALSSSEATQVYTALSKNSPYVIPPRQHLYDDTRGLLLWINPYLNFTSKSASPLRHIRHSTALPETGSYDTRSLFKTWDTEIFPQYPEHVEPTKDKKTVPNESSALQNLSSTKFGIRKLYLKVNTSTRKVTTLLPPEKETTLKDKQERLTINTIFGDTSEYDYNYLYRYFSGYSDNLQDPVSVYKDDRGIPILEFTSSIYRIISGDKPTPGEDIEFSLICYEIQAPDETSLENPIICLNAKPSFSKDSTEEEQCLLTLDDSYSLCVHKVGGEEDDTATRTVEFRKKTSGAKYTVLISTPMTCEEARITLAYSVHSKSITLAVNNCLNQVTVGDNLPVLKSTEGVLNVRLFLDTTDISRYASPYKGSIYDIRLYNRSAQLLDLFALHMGTFRELYSYSPFNNILGYNIYKDIGITKILWGNYAIEKVFPNITHFRVFKRSVWDSILLDLGFEKDGFQLEDDVDIIDPEDSNNTYAISQKLIERIETLSNQIVSREDALEIVSTLGRYDIKTNDIYSIASLMLYPVKYDDANFTFDANKIQVTLSEDLTTLTLTNLAIPVSGDTSTLKLSTTLAPNFLAKNHFKFTSAESTGSNILSQYYDSTVGVPMVKRVGENNSVRDVNLNYLSVPIYMPSVTSGYFSGLILGKTQITSSIATLLRATSYYDELQIPGVIPGVNPIEYTKYTALRFLREGSYFISCSYPLQIRPYNRSALPEAQEYPILYGKVQFKIEVSSEDHELDESAKKSQGFTTSGISNLEYFSIDPTDNRTFPHKNIDIRLYSVDNPVLIGTNSPIYKLLASNVPTDVFDYVETSDTEAQAETTYYAKTSPYYIEAPFSAGNTYHKDDSGNMVSDSEESLITEETHYVKKDEKYIPEQLMTGEDISDRTLYIRQPKNNGIIYLDKAQIDKGLYVDGLKVFLGENYKAPFWTASDAEEVPSSARNTTFGSGTFKQYSIGPEDLPKFVVDANKAYTLLLDYDAYISEFTFIDNPNIPDEELRDSLPKAVNHIQNPDRYFYLGAPIAIEENSAVRTAGSGFKLKNNAANTYSWEYGKQSSGGDVIQYFGNPNARSTDKNFLVKSGKNLSITALKQAMDSYSYPLSSSNANALYLQSTTCYTSNTKTTYTTTRINEKSLIASIRDTRVRNLKSHIVNFSSSNLIGLLTGLSDFSLMMTDNMFTPMDDVKEPEIMDKSYSYFKYLSSIVPISKRNNLLVKSDTFYQNNLFTNTDFSDISHWSNKLKVDGSWVIGSLDALGSYISDPWIDGMGKMVYSLQGSDEYRLEYVSSGISYTDKFEIAISVKVPDNSPVQVKAICYENSKIQNVVELKSTKQNSNGWTVYSKSEVLTNVNTITFEFIRSNGEGPIYVSKPVARVCNHISGIRGFSNVERTERTTNDTTTFSIPYPNVIVLKNNETQNLVPISFDPKVLKTAYSVQVLSGAQVMSEILSQSSIIGKPESTQYLVPIVSPWDRMISLSGYEEDTKSFNACYSYKLYTESSSNTEIHKTIDASIYDMNRSEFVFNETAGEWSGKIYLTNNNIFKSYPCNLHVRRDKESLRLKDSSFSLLTNCFNPEAVLRGEDSEVCITNIQAYNLSEEAQEQRILEMEYLPLIYNELSQHISINLILNKMNSYAPTPVGETSKELYNTRLPQPECMVIPGITSDYGTLAIANAYTYAKFGNIDIKVVQDDKVLTIEKCDTLRTLIESNNLIYTTALGTEDFEPSPETEGFNPQLYVQEPVEKLYHDGEKLMLSLECDTPGSVIRYTVSNSNSVPKDPTETSTLYTGPIEYLGTPIKARGFRSDLNASEVLTIEERLVGYSTKDTVNPLGFGGMLIGFQGRTAAAKDPRLATPIISCTYPDVFSGIISLDNETDYAGEDVYIAFYADGTKIATLPAKNFVFNVTENAEYTARAFSTGRRGSYRSEGILTELQVPTPVIQINTSIDTSTWTVEMSCSLEGSVIHYTLNDVTPTDRSPVYTAPISYSGETVKAIAIKDGLQYSEIAVAGSAILQIGEDFIGYNGDALGYHTL